MSLIIDASVAVKWFVDEDRHELARQILARDDDHFAPDLALVEVANALRNKVRIGQMDRIQAEDAIENLPDLLSEVIGSQPLVKRAFEISLGLNHPVADCVYVALAEALSGVLVTDDTKLVAKTTVSTHGQYVKSLSDFGSPPASPQ